MSVWPTSPKPAAQPGSPSQPSPCARSLLSYDPSYEVETLELEERLGIPEDEEIFLYKVTRPSPPAALDAETQVFSPILSS